MPKPKTNKPPNAHLYPEVRGPMAEILALCTQYEVPFGTTALNAEAGRRWVEEGALFFEAADELQFIGEGATNLVTPTEGL